MIIILQAFFLFLFIFLVMPIIFLFLIGLFGGWFVLDIDKDSWIAKTERRWIKFLFRKFIS